MRPIEVPIDLTGEQARRLAELELADPAYRAAEPGLLQRLLQRIIEWVADITGRAADAAPGGWLGILGLVLLLVLAALFIRWRVGPVARSGELELHVDPGTSAARYRQHAAELAATGQWEQAITERMRGLVRGCQERGLIDTQAGRTADEVAAEVGTRLPDARADLARAARTFDDVRYGGRRGTEAAYRLVADADDRVARSQPVATHQPAAPPMAGQPAATR